MSLKSKMLLVLLLLLPFSLLANDPAPPTPETVSIQQQWYRLTESISKLQKIIDNLTEEVDNFSTQLAEEISTHPTQPTQSIEPIDQQRQVQELTLKVEALEQSMQELTQKVNQTNNH